jgi:transcriptional regulator with XRE-family HTH domain
MEIIGKRIREQRELQNLKQETLAEMVEISNTHMSQIERGKKEPSIKAFIRIVNALNIPADFLLRDELKNSSPILLNDITEKMTHLTKEQVEFVTDLFNFALTNFSKADKMTE